MRVVCVIPTYNEAENIEETLRSLGKWNLLVVDDNSPDGTGAIAQKHKGVRVLSGKKAGLGTAMARGIRYALDEMRADVVVTNEADGAYDPKYIPEMIAKIEAGCDVVIASRYKTEGWNWHRDMNHWLANTVWATWIAGQTRVLDHNGALRAVRAEVLRKIDWADMPRGFGFFNYWLFKMTRVTDKICEVPVVYRFRTKGESKVSFNPKYVKNYLGDVWEYLLYCVKIRLAS